MTNPLISVIVPVYNVSKYLRKCLDSIINQTYKNLEIILIDDGSTDESPKICDEYAQKDKRIKVIHKQNEGVSIARNTALDIVKGEYVGFVDSDDYIKSDMYEYLYNLIKIHKKSIAICNVRHTQNGILCPIYNDIKVFTPNQFMETFLGQLFVCNKLFPTSVVKDIRFPLDITLGEDTYFCFQTFQKVDKLIYGSEDKYIYFMNIQSATKKTFNVKKLTYFKISDIILNYAKDNNMISLYKKVLQSRIYMIVGFLRQMCDANFNDKVIINNLIKEIRQNIFLYLMGKFKLTNKLFAIMCCVNFNLASKIYQKIGN